MHIVIIGNGVAGMEAALTVRHRLPEASITIVSEESAHFFSRTALMYVLSGQLSHEDIEPHERDLYARMRFSRVRARATGVDVAGRRVLLAGGLDPLPYDRLLIACGSRPRPGPWPGSDLRGIGHFVTHQDLGWLEQELYGGPGRGGPPPEAEAHLARSTPDSPYRPRPAAAARRGRRAERAAVIGGGLIGIEVVEVMVAAGLHPHFFIREEYFWPIALNADESGWIADRMAEHGVQVHLGTGVERFEADEAGNVAAVVDARGQRHAIDCAVIAIGVQPNTDWLRGSDIELDEHGGVVVGPDLSTSAPGVHAAGDCASVRWFNGVRRPEQLWYTARDQGRVAARAMLGDDVRYQRGRWYNSAKLFDIEYTTAGLVDFGFDDMWSWYWEERGTVRSTTRVCCRGDRVVGFNLLGRRWDHTTLIRWIAERRTLPWVLEHLSEARFDTELVPPLRLPADAISQARRQASAHLSPAS